MSPPSKHLYFLSLILIVGPSTIFYIYTIPTLFKFIGYSFIIPHSILLLISISMLTRTRYMNPGYIPKQQPQNIEESNNNNNNEDDNKKKKKKKIIYFDNGISIQVQYCKTCGFYRPPRSSHCSDCDRCVFEHDHHCPWVGNCVGHGNYKQFCYFVWSTFLVSISTVTLSMISLYKLSSQYEATVYLIANHPIIVIIFAYSLLLLFTLIGLSGYHLYLVSVNLTTKENVKGLVNPYQPTVSSKKNCLKNYIRFIFVQRFNDFPEFNSNTFPILNIHNDHNCDSSCGDGNISIHNYNLNNSNINDIIESSVSNNNNNNNNIFEQNSNSTDRNSNRSDTIINIDESLQDVEQRNREIEDNISSSLDFDVYEDRDDLDKQRLLSFYR